MAQHWQVAAGAFISACGVEQRKLVDCCRKRDWLVVGLTRHSWVGSRIAGSAKSERQFAGLRMATMLDALDGLLFEAGAGKLPFV